MEILNIFETIKKIVNAYDTKTRNMYFLANGKNVVFVEA